VSGEIACADAHAIAAQACLSAAEVGRVINQQTKLRVNRCQLGLFGYGLKSAGKSKIVLSATNMPDDIVAALRAACSEGVISCTTVWEIGAQFKYPRLGMANICQSLDLRIKPCQLGCF
jgi:hypothetical protein